MSEAIEKNIKSSKININYSNQHFKFLDMTEKFCLKWNDFTTNTTKTFGLLRKEDFLQDVTLVRDDNHQVAAHKLVLSSCSKFFKNIFTNSKHSHPLICLDGITSTELDNILNYMYDGEVNIFQDDLDRFPAVAQRFKLEGLLGDPQQQEEEEHYMELGEELPKTHTKHYSNTLKKEKSDTSQNLRLDNRETVAHQNLKVKLSNDHQLAKVGNDDVKIYMSQEDKQNLDTKVNQYVERSEDGLFYCNVCGKSAKQKIVVKNHVEAKHLEGIEIPCPICGKIFRSRPCLRVHQSYFQKQK